MKAVASMASIINMDSPRKGSPNTFTYHVFRPLIGVSFFQRLGVLAMPAPDFGLATEQDEGITRVERISTEGYLSKCHSFLGSFDAK
jgi:hypothetical protein